MTLVQSVCLIEETVEYMEQVRVEPMGVSHKDKMHSVLNKNPGLLCIKEISDVHCEMNGALLQNEPTLLDMTSMKKCTNYIGGRRTFFQSIQICFKTKSWSIQLRKC